MDKNKARTKLAKMCSIKEICRYDAAEKLRKWEVYSEAEEIIEWLEDNKFIDDARYAEFYVRDKYRFNKWGRIKIAYHLKHKGIPSSVISEAFKGINEDEYKEILKALLVSKLKSIKDSDKMSVKAKMYRYAQGKGYEPDLIIPLVNSLLSSLE